MLIEKPAAFASTDTIARSRAGKRVHVRFGNRFVADSRRVLVIWSYRPP